MLSLHERKPAYLHGVKIVNSFHQLSNYRFYAAPLFLKVNTLSVLGVLMFQVDKKLFPNSI